MYLMQHLIFECRYIMKYYLIRFLPAILHFSMEIAIQLITLWSLWAVPLSFVPHGHLYLRMAFDDIMKKIDRKAGTT